MAGDLDPIAQQAFLAEDSSGFPFQCSIASIVIVTLAYALQFWARNLQSAPWDWFDWLMIPAYISNIGMGVCGILAVNWGTGRHLAVLYLGSEENFDRWGLLTFYVSGMVYYAGITFPRLSILCFYHRFFQDKYARASIWLVVVLMFARLVAEMVIAAKQCDHMRATWHIELWKDHCSTLLQHYTYGRIPNILVDVIMLIIPIPRLWSLRVATDVKLGLIATFSLGAFGTVTAVIGFASFAANIQSFDLSWIAAPMMAWTVLEPAVYFISACMLTYKPLVRSLFKTKAMRSLVQWFGGDYPAATKSTSKHLTAVTANPNFYGIDSDKSSSWKFRELPPLPHERDISAWC